MNGENPKNQQMMSKIVEQAAVNPIAVPRGPVVESKSEMKPTQETKEHRQVVESKAVGSQELPVPSEHPALPEPEVEHPTEAFMRIARAERAEITSPAPNGLVANVVARLPSEIRGWQRRHHSAALYRSKTTYQLVKFDDEDRVHTRARVDRFVKFQDDRAFFDHPVLPQLFSQLSGMTIQELREKRDTTLGEVRRSVVVWLLSDIQPFDEAIPARGTPARRRRCGKIGRFTAT
jgi:hypothetical protein